MKLWVAGRERNGGLGREIGAQAAALEARDDAPEYLKYEHSAAFVNSSRNERDFMDKFISLLLARTGASTSQVWIPRRPGWRGLVAAGFKRLLWKLTRYQHEHIAFQQNVINLQTSAALEFMRKEYTRRIDELTEELKRLNS